MRSRRADGGGAVPGPAARRTTCASRSTATEPSAPGDPLDDQVEEALREARHHRGVALADHDAVGDRADQRVDHVLDLEVVAQLAARDAALDRGLGRLAARGEEHAVDDIVQLREARRVAEETGG